MSVWTGNGTAQDRSRANDLAWSEDVHTAYAAGKSNDSFDFSSRANVPTKSAVFRAAAVGLNAATQLSVSLWAQPLSTEGKQIGNLFELAPIPASSSTALRVVLIEDEKDLNKVVLGFGINGGLKLFPPSSRLPQADSWTHYVATFASGAGVTKVRLFVDGEPLAEQSVAGELPLLADAAIKLGGEYSGSAYHGKLDEVALYRRALSATEVSALYQSVAPPPCP